MKKSASEPTLEQLRLAEGLSQEELALALGVTDQTISNWEVGKTQPKLTLDQWITYWSTLKCTPEQLRTAAVQSWTHPAKSRRRKPRST